MYNKERETNKHKDDIIKNLGLKTIPKTIIEFKKMIQSHYVSKNKIKEKIKELNIEDDDLSRYARLVLKELLEV